MLRFPGLLVILILASWPASAQNPGAASAGPAPVPALITRAVDETQRVVLKGNTHPFARPQFDQGAAPANLPMERMTLVLLRSPQQDAALKSLIDSQQDKSSPNFHQWLTPAEFGRQFGPADADIQAITAWLESHGFQVAGPSKGKTAIEFSGTAGQVQAAFGATIHKYVVNGEPHWANSSDPSIPVALAPAVKGVLTLHNFPRRSHLTVHQPLPLAASRAGAPLPLFTFTSNRDTFYALGPTDFATIYNVLPLWNAGIDGTGQTIAVAGETDISISDVENFRSIFGLPANDPQIIVNGVDPGVDGDETEALLDVSWSGAVAKNATIDLVVSASTEASLGVDLSALYIVDNNIAPVLSDSYGVCESVLGNAGNAFYNSLWQQAAAEGITVLVAAGDGGSAGCDNFDTEFEAQFGLAVSGFASTPYNIAVGGTDFDQTAVTAPNYWSATNNPTTGASAKSYIPETTWNDSCAGLGLATCTDSSNYLDIVAASGGPSNCATQDKNANCLSGYAKPSWQVGSGVPQDGVRDIPDVSLFASNGFNNSFYIICEADAGFFGTQLGCDLSTDEFVGLGGTSASTPAFAGIMALVNQKMAAQGLSARQGNANYILYKLAAQNGASCNSSTVALTGNSCLFYDVTQGNISVPCYPASPNCGAPQAPGTIGDLVDPENTNNPAWETTPGYDMATGLGSVNANNLVIQWSSVSFAPSVTTIASLSPTSVGHGQPVNLSVTVAPKSGSGTPTGSVTLFATPSNGEISSGVFPVTNGVATGSTTLLPGGAYNVFAQYSGDANYGASQSANVQVTVGKENSETSATLVAYDFTTGSFYKTNSIPYGTIFFLRSDVTNSSGKPCAPNPQETQAACPTGSVSYTLNGKTLDAGSYALNAMGYTEDQTSTNDLTALGTYSVQAQYSGDNSFNSSGTTVNVAVTQTPTTMENFGVLNICCLSPITVDSGQTFQINATTYAWSVFQAPSGAITFLQNGGAPSGTASQISQNGSYAGTYSTGTLNLAYLSSTLTVTIDTAGTYSYTASYPGDMYYGASQNQWPLSVVVLDTTFQITSPIPSVTISAPGKSGTALVGLVGVDNFDSSVIVTCTLPASMTESSCPQTYIVLSPTVTSANAQLQITTTGPHQIAANQPKATSYYAAGLVAGFFLFAVPGIRRRKLPQIMLVLVCLGFFASCGSNGGGSGGGGAGQTDPGTPAGTYTVNVTAVANGITRTGTFQVTVQ